MMMLRLRRRGAAKFSNVEAEPNVGGVSSENTQNFNPIVTASLYTLHPGQRRLSRLMNDHRFVVASLGRRWGKTYFADDYSFNFLIDKPERIAMWVAPTFDLGSIAWDEWHRIVPPSLFESNKTDRTIKLINGSRFFFRSADRPDSLIGRGLDLLIIDEAARVSEDAIERALLPSVADRGGKILAITTPLGKRNWVYRWYKKGLDPSNPLYGCLTGSSTENPNPEIKRWVQSMMPRSMGGDGEMPEDIFIQEILAQFLDDAAAVFRNIMGCIDPSLSALQSTNSEDWAAAKPTVIGIDVAKHRDYTVMSGARILPHEVVKMTCWDRWHRIPWPQQVQRIVSHCKAAGSPVVYLDATGVGDAVYDDLVKAGLFVFPYKFSTNEAKVRAIQRLSLDMQNSKIRYPNVPVYLSELEDYSYEISTSGVFKYSAPDNLHDDCVISLALMNLGARRLARQADFRFLGQGKSRMAGVVA